MISTMFFTVFSFAASRWHAEQYLLYRISPRGPQMATPAGLAAVVNTKNMRAARGAGDAI